MANRSASFIQQHRDRGAQMVEAAGQSYLTRRTGELRRAQTDFNNYLNSGSYSAENNKKYRDMATQAVADLDAEMKRYGKSSNEYKTLDSYKNYYQNALPTFDRLDVGTNVQDYLSYDQDKGFTNWHSQDDYNTQKSYLDQQKQAVQSSITAEEKKLKDSGAATSADLESMKAWQAQLDEYGKLIDQRNEFDKVFDSADKYAAYERSFDYKNTMQAEKTLEQQRADLEAKQAELTQLEMKFGQSKNNLGIWAQNAANTAQGVDTNTNAALEMLKDPEGYQRMLDLQKETASLRDNVSKLEEDLGLMQYYQDLDIEQNFGKYDPKVNWQEIVDEKKEDRRKAEETYGKDSEEYAKIDRQIKFLAGANEDGTGQDGLFSDDSYLGRYELQGIDVDAERKKYDDIEQQLKDRGAATTASESWWRKLGTAAQTAQEAQTNPWGAPETAARNTEVYALESDEDIMKLRSDKQDLNQKIQSAEKYQNRADKENKYNALGEATQAELIAAAKGAISEDGKGYTDANGKFHRVDRLEYLTDDMEPELRDQIYAAIGAEILGKDIGYTVDEIADAYEARMNQAAGYTWGKKLHDLDSDFLRWNAQVLGTGTQAGVWQFLSGMKQFFTEDMVEPSAMSAMAQYTREDLKRYGNEQILAGSSQGGSNVSQLLFDTAQTTGNMLPMIITSALLAKAGLPEAIPELVGAGMMSMSSYGNTYQQALAEGWEKEDARTFAAITGAAEGAMQYLIGGISELGGVSEEQLLSVAKRINDAGLRFVTETGVHILSETTEELAQNRLESYLKSQFRGEDFTWWDDDDWYTVIVTALSTGALEGPKAGIQIHRDIKTGEALTGAPIQSKALTASQRQWNENVNKVGKLLNGDVAARESLLSFATDPELVEEGGDAYKLATYMKEHPNRVNALNIGRLYSEIIAEYQQANKKSGVLAAMSGIIGGAIQYHSGQKLQTEVQAADERAAEIRRANPNAAVLDLNASELAKAGVEEASAKEYGIILNKVMSGTDLTETEMGKLLGDSTAAKAARELISRQSSDPEALRNLNLSMTRGNTEAARAAITSRIEEVRESKRQLEAAKQTAITEAQRDAVAKAQVNESVLDAEPGNPVFGNVQDLVDADTISAMQKADADKASAERKLAQLENMSPDTRRSLGQAAMLEDANEKYAGVTEGLIGSKEIEGLMQQAEGLEETIEKLRSVKFPSRQQSMELADAREQLARVNSQIDQLQGQQAERAIARAKAQEEAQAKAQAGAVQGEAARNSSGSPEDVATVGNMTMTRAEYIDNAVEQAQKEAGDTQLSAEAVAAIREQADGEFDQLVDMTGGKVNEDGRRDQSGNPEEERNDVGDTADRGEDRSRGDQPGRSDLGRGPAGGTELFAANSANRAVYASAGATVTDVSQDQSLEAGLEKDHPGITGLGRYLLDSGFTSVRFVTNGQILVESVDPKTGKVERVSVAALVRGTEMVLSLDFNKKGYDFRATAEHERTHLRLKALDRDERRAFISSTLQNLLGKDVYANAFKKYLEEYGALYKGDSDVLGHMINEEMFCDMVAGINEWGAGLGEYKEDIGEMLSESNFDAITNAIAEGDELDIGLIYEETEAMPFGYQMKETVDLTDPFRNDVDRSKPPESRPLPGEEAMHEDQQLMSLQSMAEATGFKLLDNDEGVPYALENLRTGEIVDKVTPHMMIDTPIGKLVTTAKDSGFISNYAADREYVMLSQVMNLILQNKDAALTWELVGSQLFSGIKKNSDTQYNWTVDFGTICRKTQALINAMSATMKKVGHGLSRREIEAVYLETGLAGEATPCPVCYVFSRWMGIGGLLDDINTFQNMYFKPDGSWADGRSEADLAAFMSGVESDVKAWAREKQKKDFFKEADAENKFAQDNLNFGKILSDMKSSPNRILADATKKINDSRQAALIIRELESAVEKATPVQAEKLNKAIATMRDYLLTDDQVKAQEARIEQAKKDLSKFDRYQWAARAVMQRTATDRFKDGERVYEWTFRSDYKPVPQDVLFDLNKGEEFAKNYPLTWAFRTGKGNAMGKAIMPYSDARVGETIQGVATKNTKVLNEDMIKRMGVSPDEKKAVARAMKSTSAGIKSGATLNPFVKETALRKNLDEALASGDKKAIRAAQKALAANEKEQKDYLDRAKAAIRKQNLIGGMRMQSTSDFRFEWGSDYLTTFFELQAIGANVQLYTKVIEAVDFLASTGSDCNLSVMPRGLGYSNGKLEFSDVTGINATEALKKAKQYDNVQLILVGISDENIRLALAGTEVTFVIPFHGSGQSVDQVQTLVNLLGEDLNVELAQDYSDVQDDHIDPRLSKEEAAKAKAMRALRMDIIQGKFWQNGTKKAAGHNKPLSDEQKALLRENPHLARLYDMFYNEIPSGEYTPCMIDAEGKSLAYHCFLGKEQAEKIFPYEYWDTSLEYKDADQNGENFKAYCKSLGIIPRFSGLDADGKDVGHGNFTDAPGYWKLLIDRKMYKNVYDANGNWVGYGAYRNQQKINVSNVKVGMLNEPTVRQNINKDAWTKDIHSDVTESIAEKSAARIQEMEEKGDVYDTKKISKEFRADRLSARKDMREAEQQLASLQKGEEITVSIPDGTIRETGEPVNFIEKLLDGTKWGETRDHNHMAYKNWVGLTKDGMVYGRVKFGKPYLITRDSPEYAHAFIEGTEYDIPEGGSKWFYPVEAKQVFENPVPNTPNGNYGKYTIPAKGEVNVEPDRVTAKDLKDKAYTGGFKTEADWVNAVNQGSIDYEALQERWKSLTPDRMRDLDAKMVEYLDLISPENPASITDRARALNAFNFVLLIDHGIRSEAEVEFMIRNLSEDTLRQTQKYMLHDFLKNAYRAGYQATERILKNQIRARVNLKPHIGHDLEVEQYGTLGPMDVRRLYNQLASKTDTETNALAKKVFDWAVKMGKAGYAIPFKFKDIPQTANGYIAGAHLGGKVRYDISYFNNPDIPDAMKAHVLLHETIHAYSAYAINLVHMNDTITANPGTRYRGGIEISAAYDTLPQDVVEAVRTLDDIFAEIKDDPDFDGLYGAVNTSEMVAELSNPTFRAELKKKTLLQRILDAVKKLFGIDTTNAYDSVSAAFDKLMTSSYDHDIQNGIKAAYSAASKEYANFYRAEDSKGRKVIQPKGASLTNRTASEYNEDTQQRFSKQGSDSNGRTEDKQGSATGVDRLDQLLQKNNWTRSYLEAARKGAPGVRARDIWRTTERRQREIIDNVSDFFFDHPYFAGREINELFDYGVADFIDWFFTEAATRPEWLMDQLERNLYGPVEKLIDIFDKGLKDNKAPKGFNPNVSDFVDHSIDDAYLRAIKKNDSEALARMVFDEAKKYGYDKELFQHAAVHFTAFDRGEFGFHLGSESQALTFINQSMPNPSPDLFLHLYANIRNPYVLPTVTVNEYNFDTGEYEDVEKNDLGDWRVSDIAGHMLRDPFWANSKYAGRLQKMVDERRYDTNKYGSTARKKLTDILDEAGFDALQYTNAVEGKRGMDPRVDQDRAREVGVAPFTAYDPERDNNVAYIIWDPGKLKSGDLITYDEDGYVIPLSLRFEELNDEFRYSKQSEDASESLKAYPEGTLQGDLLRYAQSGDSKALENWINKQFDKAEQKKENAKVIPPRVPTREFVPDVSEAEKAILEKTRLDRIAKYGALPPSEVSGGEKGQKHKMVLPAKNDKGQRQARFVQNVMTADQQLNQKALDQAKRFAFTNEVAAFVPDSNEKSLENARKTIKDRGYEYAKNKFSELAEEMTWSYFGADSISNTLALGQQLLIESATNGTTRDYLDILASLTLLSTQAGKSLQAFRMLKESGPIGELYYVQKTVDQLNNKKYAKLIEGKKMSAITINPDLQKAVVFAKTDKAREEAMNKLIKSIADQVPVTIMDKLNTWRHFAMLGNARTHIRNVFGNAIFVPLRYGKDLMAAAGEAIAVNRGWMKEEDRTKAIRVDKQYKDFAKQDAEVMKRELQGNGKYDPVQDIMAARQIFWWKPLDKASKWNGNMLEKEDWDFLRPAYTKALGMALQHSGFTAEELQNTIEGQKALNRARKIAIEEAQRATYRDFSAAAAALNRLKRSGGIGGILLEGVLPFTKTPINILKRGMEYSPIGIAQGVFEVIKGAKNQNMNGAEIIDRLCAGLTGTGMAILGYILASAGIARGADDDEKQEKFDKLQGYQDYSLQLGDVSLTIDWAAPTALPFFTGVAAYDLLNDDHEMTAATVMSDAWNAIMLIAEPMMSLSMLDGLNNTLSSVAYGSKSDQVVTIASSAATSYLGQFLPTMLGQLARTIDGTRRQTYIDKNSPIPKGAQQFIQSSVQNKVPVWESGKAAYIDEWGRTSTEANMAVGALENFLSPSYINIVNTTDVDEKLQAIYTATGESKVLPSVPSKTIGKRNLSADEFVQLAQDAGQTKYQLLTQLTSDSRFIGLDDSMKVKIIHDYIYEYANTAAKFHVDPSYDIRGQGVWIEEAEAMPNDLLRYNRIWEQIEKMLEKNS